MLDNRKFGGAAFRSAILSAVLIIGGLTLSSPAVAQPTLAVGQNIMVTQVNWDTAKSRGEFLFAFDRLLTSSIVAYMHTHTDRALLQRGRRLVLVGRDAECDGPSVGVRCRVINASIGSLDQYAPNPDNILYDLGAGSYYFAITRQTDGTGTFYTPAADALGGENRPIVFPTPAQPTAVTASVDAQSVKLSWTRAMGSNETHYRIYQSTSSPVDISGDGMVLDLATANCPTSDMTRSCETTLSDLAAGDYHFRVLAINDSHTSDKTGRRGLEAASATTEMVTVDAPPTLPTPSDGSGGNGSGNAAADSGGGSGGAIAAIAIAAGAYFWWKKRQIANGNAAAVAFLPDVDFDLDRNDRRAFYTKMNWANSSHSNWQLRGNATIHTKYWGELLGWNANSHIGYRLKGKFGEFNPYLRGKFVQNAPENAEMEEIYTLGVNYSVPNRFSVQFLQPDDEIWRYSLKTEVHLPNKIVLKFNQPNSDIWRYSANLNWQISERIGLNLSQPNNDLPNYGFGVQWRGKSQIRYGISGETGLNSYRFTGEFSF